MHENIGLRRQFAPLVKVTDGNILRYEIDFDAFEAAMGSGDARTRMFLLCNPHNPTGNSFTRKQLSRLAEICLRHDVIICSDEIHSELLLDGTQHTPIATLLPEVTERTITLVAPSKTFNTAGLFCGFAIIPNPDLRARYQKAVGQMTLHVNSLGQVAAQAAFAGDCDDWLAEVLAYLTANRDFLAQFMQENLPEIRFTVPEATYLAWLDCNPLLESGKLSGSSLRIFPERGQSSFERWFRVWPRWGWICASEFCLSAFFARRWSRAHPQIFVFITEKAGQSLNIRVEALRFYCQLYSFV